jgi:hypothetical protein
MSQDGETILNKETVILRFYDPFARFHEKKENWCDMTIICKETQFENKKIYYDMNYEYSYSGEEGKKANPFYGSQDISHGDYIYKNIMTEQLIKLIMLPFSEFEKYNGGVITNQQYKTDLLRASEHLWD